MIEAPDDAFVVALRARWAQLIRKVYEVDPLACPRCGQPMRIIALIEAPATVERILRHVGAWGPQPPLRGPTARGRLAAAQPNSPALRSAAGYRLIGRAA